MSVSVIDAAMGEKSGTSWSVSVNSGASGYTVNPDTDMVLVIVAVRRGTGSTATISSVKFGTVATEEMTLTSHSSNPLVNTGDGLLDNRDHVLHLYYGLDMTLCSGLTYSNLGTLVTPSASAVAWVTVYTLRADGNCTWALSEGAQMTTEQEADAGGTHAITIDGASYTLNRYGHGLVSPVAWVSRLDANTDGISSAEVAWTGSSATYLMDDTTLSGVTMTDGPFDDAGTGVAASGSHLLLHNNADDPTIELIQTIDWNPADGATDAATFLFSGFYAGIGEQNPHRATRRLLRATALPYDLRNVRLRG